MNSIAIVTPSFNQGRYIRQTIESVLSQEVQNLVYFVVDGGSTDETLDILRSFGGRLKWLSERDKGSADAINKGFEGMKANILGWLNSDDIYYDGTLRTVQEFFEEHPDVDVVYGDANHIGDDGSF